MALLKLILKIALLPVLIVTGILWLMVKTVVWIYGMMNGILGLAIAVFVILFLGFQEWTNAVVMIGIAAFAFLILFLGAFVQEMLAMCNRGIWKFITA
ncbi:MAG: hypothetical protein U0L05_04790 [Schaedlerella sp.]|nr:hypothetical protein [Schaedlerella sp.]